MKGGLKIIPTKTKLMRVSTKLGDGDMVLHVTNLRVSMLNVNAVLLETYQRTEAENACVH